MYKIVDSRIFDRYVIAVAVADGSWWTAYIGAVPGENHREEEKAVLKRGTKIPQNVAEVIFPDMPRAYQWRE